MTRILQVFLLLNILAALVSLPVSAAGKKAGKKKAGVKKGNKIEGDFFGPTGIHGSVNGKTLVVTGMQKGSPAQGKLNKGDVIIGVGQAKFKNPKRDMVRAIDVAEGSAAQGQMALMLNGGRTVTISLPVLGDYSRTAPYNCPKTDRIITMTADRLMKGDGDYLGIEILALMATGEKKYIDAATRLISKAKWAQATDKPLKNYTYCTWHWGYRAIVLAEYYLLTGDESVLPVLKSYALALARGQDNKGEYGHQCADPKNMNRLPGYGAMAQPTLSCFMGMLLARKAGIKDPLLDKAIAATSKPVQDCVGKGAFAYSPGTRSSANFNNNGTSGSATICLELLGNCEGARYFSRCAATSYEGLEKGHASAYFNPLWTTLGAVRAGPQVTSEHFRRILWFYNVRRNFDGRWSGDEKPGSLDGVALLNYCIGRKALVVTGRDMDESIWAKGEEVGDIIGLNKFECKGKSAEEVIALAMGHTMPQIRRKAIASLGSHRKQLTPTYIKWLESGTAEQKKIAISQYGWWIKPEKKLAQLPAIAAIMANPDEPRELRKAAAGSIAYMGKPAVKYYMDMLKLEATPGSSGVAKYLLVLCPNPFKSGVVTDKDLLYKVALRLAGSRSEGGRKVAMNMLVGMPLEDFHRVAEKVLYVIEGKDPRWTSANSPQNDVGPALRVLASLNIKEGIDHALKVFDYRPKAKGSFVLQAVWTGLAAYGANAREALETYQNSKRHSKNKNYGRLQGKYVAMVKAVRNGKTPPKLISMAEAIAAGRK